MALTETAADDTAPDATAPAEPTKPGPQRLSARRLDAAIAMIESGIDDLAYRFADEGFVSITLDDAGVRASIAEASAGSHDGQSCGIYEVDDVWAAVQRYRDATAALEILTARQKKQSKAA